MTGNIPRQILFPRLRPRPDGTIDARDLHDWSNAIAQALETIIADIQVQAQSYSVTNLVTKRSLDGTAGTAADVRQVLATLVNDLRNRSILG